MKKLLLVLIAILVVAGTFYFSQNPKLLTANNPQPSASVAPESREQQFTVSQTIDFGGAKPVSTSSAQVKKGDTAFDLLAKTQTIESKQYSFGKSVESIDAVKGGVDNKYWMFYVNGALSQVGSDQYQLKNNDKIVWKLEKGQ